MPQGWKRAFDDPIPLPGGRQLGTLQDAGNYITKLPKAEHEAAGWQAAMEALILVATSGGPTMFARIGLMRGLKPPRRARVRSVAKREALGPPDAGEGSMTDAGTNPPARALIPVLWKLRAYDQYRSGYTLDDRAMTEKFTQWRPQRPTMGWGRFLARRSTQRN